MDLLVSLPKFTCWSTNLQYLSVPVFGEGASSNLILTWVHLDGSWFWMSAVFKQIKFRLRKELQENGFEDMKKVPSVSQRDTLLTRKLKLRVSRTFQNQISIV